LLIFDIDIVFTNNESRYIIRSVKKLENEFNNIEKKINIFIPSNNLLSYKDDLFLNKKSHKCKIAIFLNINNKLVNLDVNNNYSLKSYKQLDSLKNSKKLDYNIDIA